MAELDDVVKEFLVESHENLDALDRLLVELEQTPDDRENLASIFRTIHTIKGTCGFLGFSKLESISHVGENLLSRMRDGKLHLNAEIATALLQMVDAIRQILTTIEATASEGDHDYTALVAELNRLNTGSTEAAAHAPAATPVAAAPPVVETPPVPVAAVAVAAPADPHHDEPVAVVEEAAQDRRSGEDRRSGDDRRGAVHDASLRVDVGLLDKLMNLVGELVLARNQILQFTATQNDPSFVGATQRLNLVTSELQEGVMKTRMQPIDNVWSKFPRIVRDLATQCKKQVRIEMVGKETELDKTIIEAIKDPLTHIVRNSVDHGIEMPQARVAKGKAAEGVLRLKAFHEGGQINIEIADDGAGIDPEKIRKKAVERSLVTADQAARLSDTEVLRMIFLPGFSTAAKVTNVSGRGVGMDVVKTNIEKIGGTVDIQSQPGQGTTVRLKIPLTLAIIPALVVTCAGDRYAIPQVSLLELVRLEGEQARQGIERLHGAPVYRLRGQLLPIVYLRRELGLEGNAAAGDLVNIVVLRADDRQFGLVVDAINDTEEIVVKPLGPQLKGIPVYAGATIMGDGKVALILDVLGMAQQAKVVSEVRDRGVGQRLTAAGETTAARQTLLVLQLGERRVGLPISLVSRLEKIPREQVETADQHEVVQYRGEILPIVRLGDALGIPTTEDRDAPLQVVVYREHGRSIGLVVDRIADIVECCLDVTRPSRSEALVASAVIQQRVTDLVDLPALIRRADPTFFDTAPSGSRA